MTRQTILVIEDDVKIRTLLRNVLEDDGFDVTDATTEAEALDILRRSSVDLITLDLQLGRDDGVDLAKAIRREWDIPIIMVTGKSDVIDRVVGLEVGADDYITKPFHVREVLARVKSVLRRTSITAQDTQREDASDSIGALRFDGMTVHPDRFELLNRDGDDCGLTSGDFKLLSVFLDRPKRVLSRDQLMDLTGGAGWSPLDRTIDNQIARLRKKIERDPTTPTLIKTVRGIGYVFVGELETVQPSGADAKRA